MEQLNAAPRFGFQTARWVIVGLLFAATAINYVHRQTLSILKPTLQTELHLTEQDYANAVTAFLLAYTVMYTLSGRWIDRVGVRLGTFACVVWWSIASVLTMLTQGAASLAIFRFLLGVGEPGIFPAGLKACGEWFRKSERALPLGIFSSGSAVGAVVAPPLIAWITLQWGWREAFLFPGLAAMIWLPLWWFIYRSPQNHPSVTPADLQKLSADEPAASQRKPWLQILRQRKVWGLVLSRLASDPVWYFYLFWLPDYFQSVRHLSLKEIAIYGWIPFLFADLGNVVGGAFSDWLIRRGWSAPRARFLLLMCVGVLAPFGALVGFVDNTGGAIAITCLIAFLCQTWSTNVATLSADISAPDERATVMGMMGTSGSLGGMIFAQVLGATIVYLGYSSAFVFAAVLHPIAAITLFLMLRPVLKAEK